MTSARKFYTPEEFARDFEGRRFDLVDGTPQAMPPAKPRHARAQNAFGTGALLPFDAVPVCVRDLFGLDDDG